MASSLTACSDAGASAPTSSFTRWYCACSTYARYMKKSRSIRTASVDGETVSASEMTAWCAPM